MHELGIMESTLDMAIEEAERRGATCILRLRMKVGTLSGVVPDSLSFAFDVLTEGTMAEGASLEVEKIDVVSMCAACGLTFSPPDFICECPRCGQVSDHIIAGKELQLTAMEVGYGG